MTEVQWKTKPKCMALHIMYIICNIYAKPLLYAPVVFLKKWT